MGTGLRGKGSESGKERETIHGYSNEPVHLSYFSYMVIPWGIK